MMPFHFLPVHISRQDLVNVSNRSSHRNTKSINIAGADLFWSKFLLKLVCVYISLHKPKGQHILPGMPMETWLIASFYLDIYIITSYIY